MATDILSEFGSANVKQFSMDFMQTIKVGAQIERYYGESQNPLDTMLPKYEKLLEKFNRKYKGILIRTKKTTDSFHVRIFLKISGIKEFFADSASRIPGIKTVGKSDFNEVDVGDSENLARFLDSLLDKICLSYVDIDGGTSTIAAVFDRSKKMVEAIYNPPDMMNENSAGFKICAFYALKEGVQKDIDVYSGMSTFGFMDILSEVGKREWHDRFGPRLLE